MVNRPKIKGFPPAPKPYTDSELTLIARIGCLPRQQQHNMSAQPSAGPATSAAQNETSFPSAPPASQIPALTTPSLTPPVAGGWWICYGPFIVRVYDREFNPERDSIMKMAYREHWCQQRVDQAVSNLYIRQGNREHLRHLEELQADTRRTANAHRINQLLGGRWSANTAGEGPWVSIARGDWGRMGMTPAVIQNLYNLDRERAEAATARAAAAAERMRAVAEARADAEARAAEEEWDSEEEWETLSSEICHYGKTLESGAENHDHNHNHHHQQQHGPSHHYQPDPVAQAFASWLWPLSGLTFEPGIVNQRNIVNIIPSLLQH